MNSKLISAISAGLLALFLSVSAFAAAFGSADAWRVAALSAGLPGSHLTNQMLVGNGNSATICGVGN